MCFSFALQKWTNVELILFIVIITSITTDGRTSDKLKITLPHGGRLIGRYLNTFSGQGILAFLGIPYAKPPIEDLRFRAPVPYGPWSGDLMATTDSPLCTQRDPYRRDESISGVEDCLHLNVYVPERPRSLSVDANMTNPVLFPVMVFFHGGGWQCGSGTRSFYGPDFLLEHDVIYIGANFRLGPLGFLSTEQVDCPGNNGLKDQSLVLRWIHENIASFKGDPKSVTIFGESAGGASGTYHMMSPLSKGLFHRVISQSGVNLDAWAQPAHPGVARSRSIQLGKMLNCTKTNDGGYIEMLDCLRKVPAEEITRKFYDFYLWDTDPMIPFPPVIEPDIPGAFITKHPRDEYEPHAIELPWMTGLTFDEGALKSASLINVPELRKSLNDHWERALPISLYYDHHEPEMQRQITQKINSFYFKNQKLVTATERNLTNLYSDAWFLAGMDEYLRIRLLGHNKRNSTFKIGETYVYLFAQKASASFTEIFKGGAENYYGVCHAEELQYIFPIAKEIPNFQTAIPTEDELEIRRVIIKLWINFARTGNPTPGDEKDNTSDQNQLLPEWRPADSFPLRYLRIGRLDSSKEPIVALETGLFEERAAFWRKLRAHHYTNSFAIGNNSKMRDEL
ncbi:juvenile hormone esterase [Anopheles merus]|uniref:Carboxylesterase type B domain-containing protein n=1 Tax=Anopheles merus TaxID=30066 RepID=A0A1Y9IS12_ANOME|nr:juvenile hormone esterase [Anopheles merus]XP_041788892.1 juvenile hormone esterase [Anopheles merus]